MITVKGRDELVKKLKSIDGGFDLLGKKVTEAVVSSIKDRVRSEGIGLDGVMRYKSAKYKSWRDDRGYTTNFKNLVVTGNMLNSITYKKLGTGKYSINVASGETPKAQGNQDREPWFGITQYEQREVVSVMAEFLSKLKL